MLTASETLRQINRIVSYLVNVSLVDDQNPTFIRARTGDIREVTFEAGGNISAALRNRPYEEIYGIMSESRSYSVRMLDGALLQMMYEFARDSLRRHRLAFFPSPHLEAFQNASASYVRDELFADIIGEQIVRFPVRFDYDDGTRGGDNREHPLSHLTLGQYRDCRIPVTSPLTPAWFVDFVVRNFYDTAVHRYADGLPRSGVTLRETILPQERNVLHLAVPRRPKADLPPRTDPSARLVPRDLAQLGD